MIARDFECEKCKLVFERICDSKINRFICPKCNSPAKKIVSIGQVYMGNQDVGWLKDVKEVVDKDGGPECQAFLKNPSRNNHKKWMKAEKLRFLEPGEKFNNKVDLSKVNKEVVEKAMERRNQGFGRR